MPDLPAHVLRELALHGSLGEFLCAHLVPFLVLALAVLALALFITSTWTLAGFAVSLPVARNPPSARFVVLLPETLAGDGFLTTRSSARR
jgi:hypothetical protein